MRSVIQAIALTGVFAFLAFGQTTSMAGTGTCAEFAAMEPESQMMAVKDMQMAVKDMTSDKMMAEDNMASEGSMMAEDNMASEGSMMAEDIVSAVLRACEGNPDMMAMDAMMKGSGN